jgi:predicted SPOUT superfamily RNA methylase MTH1
MSKQQEQQQHEQDFAKGLTVKVQETKFGDIIKVGINVEAVMENPINEQGFINVEIKKAKSGKLYAVLAKDLTK